MPSHDAFLQAILADPHADGPRLVYSDWLEEHGECERAEHIRVSCEAARLFPKALRVLQRSYYGAEPVPLDVQSHMSRLPCADGSPCRACRAGRRVFGRAKARAEQLVRDYGANWFPPLNSPTGGRVNVRRGFIGEVSTSFGDFIRFYDDWRKHHPITHISLTLEPGHQPARKGDVSGYQLNDSAFPGAVSHLQTWRSQSEIEAALRSEQPTALVNNERNIVAALLCLNWPNLRWRSVQAEARHVRATFDGVVIDGTLSDDTIIINLVQSREPSGCEFRCDGVRLAEVDGPAWRPGTMVVAPGKVLEIWRSGTKLGSISTAFNGGCEMARSRLLPSVRDVESRAHIPTHLYDSHDVRQLIGRAARRIVKPRREPITRGQQWEIEALAAKMLKKRCARRFERSVIRGSVIDPKRHAAPRWI